MITACELLLYHLTNEGNNLQNRRALNNFIYYIQSNGSFDIMYHELHQVVHKKILSIFLVNLN